MDRVGRRSLILKTWERCRSLGRGCRKPPAAAAMPKTKSWTRYSEKRSVAPEGCLCVCVGAGKERFLIKMEYVNHPLFKMLLDEAEMEYGYANSDGPLELPCEVELFHGVLWEIEQVEIVRPGCNFAGGHGVYQLLSPSRTPVVYRARPFKC